MDSVDSSKKRGERTLDICRQQCECVSKLFEGISSPQASEKLLNYKVDPQKNTVCLSFNFLDQIVILHRVETP